MKNRKINCLQFSAFITFFITSSLIGISVNNVTSIAKNNSYISVIISYFIGLVFMFLFMYLFKQNRKITDLTRYIFGRVFGNIINILLLLPIMIIGICEMYNICNFIVSQFLSETSIAIIYIVFSLVILYGVYKGIETISRVNLILCCFSLILFIINVLGLVKQFNFDNLLPFMQDGIMPIIDGSFIFSLCSVVPIFLLLTISKENITDNKKINKYIIIFYSVGMILSLIHITFTVSILGTNLTNIYQYPEYMLLKKISFFNFLNRLENVIAVHWIYRYFSLISILLIFVRNLVKENTNSKVIPTITLILIIGFDALLFKNNTIFNNFIRYVYPYSNLFLVIMLFIIALGNYIKKKRTL